MSNVDFVWCDVDMVLPNPKNPRRNAGIKTEEIQNIIKNKGWEEGITVYKKGIFYIIISGHRRWFAAKQLGIKEVPLYIREAPSSDSEELERLGSVQSGQVDWSPYEWMEYTFSMYKILGNVSYSALARKFNASHNIIAARIRVYQYYPRNEIEAKLENGMYSITMLDYVRGWIERLKSYRPQFAESLGEDMIRQMMLKKLEHKCFNSDLFFDKFVINATDKEVLAFLTDANKTLKEAVREKAKDSAVIRVTNPKHNSRRIKSAGKVVNSLNYRTKKEATQLKDALDILEKEIEEKRNYLASYLKKQPTLL